MKSKIIVLSMVCIVMLSTLLWVAKGRPSFPELKRDLGTESTVKTRQTYYKWQDNEGNWHFGEQPPRDATLHEVKIDTAANIVQSVPTRQDKTPATKAAPQLSNTNTEVQAGIGLPLTVNPADIGKMVQDAHQVKALLHERNAQLQP